LGDNPTRNYPFFIRSIDDLAASLETDLDLGSIYHYDVTRSEEQQVAAQLKIYNAAIAAIADPAAQAVAAAVPFAFIPIQAPELPVAIANNANAGSVHNHRIAREQALAFRRGSNTLLQAVLASIPADAVLALRNMYDGLANVTLRIALNYVRIQFGTPTELTLAAILRDLEAPITSELQFHAQATGKAQLFSFLEDCHQPMAEYLRLAILDRTTVSLKNVVKALALYRQSEPELIDRTYGAAVAFCQRHKDSFGATAEEAGYTGAISSTTAAMKLPGVENFESYVCVLISAHLGSKSNKTAKSNTNDNRRSDSAPRPFHCSTHGACFHPDDKCKYPKDPNHKNFKHSSKV
jgi:hypothetical protein